MIKMIVLMSLFALTSCSMVNSSKQPDKQILNQVNEVVFIGDSITYSGQFIVYLEAYLKALNPQVDYNFINVGLPSETVSGLSEPNHADGKFPRPDGKERLPRILQKLTPKFVISCYGINDGIYLPFDQQRFNAYQRGQEFIHHSLVDNGVEVIHLTAPDYDSKIDAGYAKVIDIYSDWLVQKQRQGWRVIDIETPMQQNLEQHRTLEPSFFFAHDGIHPNQQGHWNIARTILLNLGYQPEESFEKSIKKVNAKLEPLAWYKLFEQKHNVAKNSYLQYVGHNRPFMAKGLPLKNMQEKVQHTNKQINLMLQQSFI